MTSEALYLEKLEDAALEMAEIPLWGSPPSFPQEEFSKQISETLEIKDFSLSQYKTEWLSREKLMEGMGKSPLVQAFSLSPLPGTYFWVMPANTHENLLEVLLKGKGKGFSDPILQEGFTTYVFIRILETLNSLNPYGNLVATLSEEIDLPEEGALAIDIEISLEGNTLWGRILVPRDAGASFKSHFTMEKPPLLADPSFSSLPLLLHLQIGSTQLTPTQWNKVSVGDFVLLDRCSFDISSHKGTAVLTLGNTALFDVRLKEGQVKILEYAMTREVYSMIEDETPPFEPKSEEEAPLGAAENNKEEILLPAEEIPIQLTVEVGKIRMPLEKVTKLKPGNILELGMGPNPDVYLVAGGKRIAKGELVSISEALGVKVLKLGE